MNEKRREEAEAYLARIRKTIADSNAVLESASLRLAETDRLLASQGLTREQVLKFNPTREQRLAVNEELRRRGLPPVEEESGSGDFSAATDALRAAGSAPSASDAAPGDELAARQRGFGRLMHQIRL